MKRREFILGTTAACLLLGSLPFSGCSPYTYVTAEEENGKLKVSKTSFSDGKWVMVRSVKANAPIFISKTETGAYDAVLMLCTHKQCEVKPSGTLLACPCHGAEFAFNGKVLKEPAEKDLAQFKTTTDENYIYIHLK